VVIRTLDDLLVYHKALSAANAVSAILERPQFAKDFELKRQLGASSSRVAALIAEGFEQNHHPPAPRRGSQIHGRGRDGHYLHRWKRS
jgi:hypothetical protein